MATPVLGLLRWGSEITERERERSTDTSRHLDRGAEAVQRGEELWNSFETSD
jgi:hypothetical protein